MLFEEDKFGDVAPAPIPPGVSWTAPQKGRLWLQPPKYVKVDEVAYMYMAALSMPEMANEMLDALETKVPLATIAETFMLAGVAKGQHTLDAGILVMPVIIEMLATIAEFNNIDYVMFNDEVERGTTAPMRVVKSVIEKAVGDVAATQEPMAAVEEPTGLMARKNKEGV